VLRSTLNPVSSVLLSDQDRSTRLDDADDADSPEGAAGGAVGDGTGAPLTSRLSNDAWNCRVPRPTRPDANVPSAADATSVPSR